jgi:CBS domain containing-hemolysin-like protein
VLQPPVLPEFATVLAALERFKREPIQIAFVVDEFGSLIGLVTATDVMEAIAGEMPDEHDPVTEMMVRGESGIWQVDGRTDIEELRQRLDLVLPEDSGYNTVAGLVLEAMGRLPEVGDEIDVDGWRFRVEAMDGNRIERVRASPLSREESHSVS